jgi:hypothetical protein
MPEIIDRRISFNGGELSPWLDPRLDLDKYRMGCRTLENMLPSVYGGALRRPGTEYLGLAPPASGKVRLVPFVASVSTAYVLEFSALKLRIWTTGATPELVQVLLDPIKEVATITVNSTGLGLDEKTFILRDSNNATVGVWLDDGGTGVPAAAAACTTQVGVLNLNFSTVTTIAAGIVSALNASGAFVASNLAGVVTVSAASGGVRTDAVDVDTGFGFAVAQQGVAAAWVSEIVTPFAEADLNALQFAQQNDVLFISHPDHFPQELARYSETDWRIGAARVFWPATMEENISATTLDVASVTTNSELEPPAWSASRTYPSGVASTSYPATGGIGQKVTHGGKYWALTEACYNVEPGSGTRAERCWMETIWKDTYSADELFAIGQVVTLTASTATFEAGHVGSKWVLNNKRTDLKVTREIDVGGAGDVSSAIYVLGEWSAMTTATTTGSGDWSADLTIERSLDNVNWETRNTVTTSQGDVNKLLTGFEKDPCFLRIKVVALVNSASIPVFLKAAIEVGAPNQHSIYEITEVTSSTVARALVVFPPWLLYGPTKYWWEPAWSSSNGYPRAVTLHQGRLYFGGTSRKPTTFWGSAVDGYTDFRVAAEDDAAVSYTLNSDEASTVEWLVSQDQLVIGTASGEWVFGARVGENEEKLRRNTSYGSLPVQARALADALVFIQRSGRKLREFAWSFDRDGYAANDLSMLAEHMGDSLFLQMAIQRNPDPVVWLVAADGALLALTYERGQKVAAWSRHVTDGLIESVACVPGSGEDDQVWVAVSRTINSVTSRYIERMKPDTIRDLKSGTTTTLVYSDCSKTTTSSASSLVTGLTHLIGETVSLLVNGSVYGTATVDGSGQVQLTNVAANQSKTVVAGLPYTSLLEPTYLETMDPASLTLAGKKRLHRAVLEFWKSGAVTVSTDAGVTYKPVTFDTGVTLMTGPLEMYLDGSTGRQVTAIFKQADPLPFNLMGLMLRYNVEMG